MLRTVIESRLLKRELTFCDPVPEPGFLTEEGQDEWEVFSGGVDYRDTAGGGCKAIRRLNVGQVSCGLTITAQTYYRWHKEYREMKSALFKGLDYLERENGCLEKPIAERNLDKLIAKKALEVNIKSR